MVLVVVVVVVVLLLLLMAVWIGSLTSPFPIWFLA